MCQCQWHHPLWAKSRSHSESSDEHWQYSSLPNDSNLLSIKTLFNSRTEPVSKHQASRSRPAATAADSEMLFLNCPGPGRLAERRGGRVIEGSLSPVSSWSRQPERTPFLRLTPALSHENVGSTCYLTRNGPVTIVTFWNGANFKAVRILWNPERLSQRFFLQVSPRRWGIVFQEPSTMQILCKGWMPVW